MFPKILAQRPVIDPSNGNLHIHGRSAPTIGYQYRAAGQLLNIAGASVALEIASYDSIAATAGPDDFTLLFTFTPQIIGALPLNTDIPFAAVDSSTWGAPLVLWSGFLRVHGYQGAPP